MAGGMQGGPGYMPARRSGTSGCVTWGLVGCGVLVLICAVLFAVGIYRFNKVGGFKMVTNIMSAQSCGRNLAELRVGLEKYTAAHKGKYPPSLSDLVPKYLPDKSALTCGGTSAGNETSAPLTMEYTPPKPNAPSDTPVVSFRSSETSILTQRQVLYLRLLKDGRIVSDSVTRTEIPQYRQTTEQGASQ
jgi:hypothetical protein